MKTWIIEPLDPVFFGDGRSVGAGSSFGRALPPPSVVAGVTRTRHGSDPDTGAWIGNPKDVLEHSVHGPWGACLDDQGQPSDWWFPAPADALVLEPTADGRPQVRRLVPLSLPPHVGGRDAPGCPVGQPRPDPAKPWRRAPPYWRWSNELEAWLSKARDHVPAQLGILGPSIESRTHVSIDPQTGTGKDGALFETHGYRYQCSDSTGRTTRLGLVVQTSATLEAGAGQMGGERRFVRWREATVAPPQIPEAVLASAAAGFVRVVLVTPACFAAGSAPGPGLLDRDGLPARVVAQVNGRPMVVSGWDMARRAPKPTRRLVPSGSVFFVALGGSEQQRQDWARARWLDAVSDDPQDRKDGFGLALLGAWDGATSPLSLSEVP